MKPGERNIFEATRHPIGILGIYIVATILLVVFAIVAFVIVPTAARNSGHDGTGMLAALGFAVVAVLMLVFVAVSHYVYWGNRWILTDDSLTQVLQNSLFDRQSSQLSLANLEDVTVQQHGILPHMFNYGTLRAETAGERSKFVLTYCPNPNERARDILEARENFEQGKDDDDAVDSKAPVADKSSQTVSFQVPTDDDLKS